MKRTKTKKKIPMSVLVQDIFKQIEIAEEEIEKAKKKWPDNCQELHKAFMLLKPRITIKNNTFFRKHCQEILKRVINSEDTTKATDVEICYTLHGLSLKAPLISDAVRAYALLFNKITGGKKIKLPPESYKGRTQEIINQLRNKINFPDRTINNDDARRTKRIRERQDELLDFVVRDGRKTARTSGKKKENNATTIQRKRNKKKKRTANKSE